MSDLEEFWGLALLKLRRRQAQLTTIMDQLRAEAVERLLNREIPEEEMARCMFQMIESTEPLVSTIGKFALMGYCSCAENIEPPECPPAAEADHG